MYSEVAWDLLEMVVFIGFRRVLGECFWIELKCHYRFAVGVEKLSCKGLDSSVLELVVLPGDQHCAFMRSEPGPDDASAVCSGDTPRAETEDSEQFEDEGQRKFKEE